jgi:hypothetical protein
VTRVDAQDFVLVQGLRETRETLDRWNARPGAVLWSWLAGSLAVVAALLLAVWVVAELSTPDPSGLALPGLNRPTSLEAVGLVLFRNSLVLALHAMACVAGFIAGSSLPLQATKHSGAWRWVHDKAGPLAIGFVVCATTFSLATQAFVLGAGASTLAAQLDISPALLLVGLLPHAVPELTALFLPLAAWIIASRRDDWHELLAATVVTVAIAVPVLIASAFVEVYVSPHLLRALAG